MEKYNGNGTSAIRIVRGSSISRMKTMDDGQLGEVAARSSLAQLVLVPTLVGAARIVGVSIWHARNALADLVERGDDAPVFNPEALLLPAPASGVVDAEFSALSEDEQVAFVIRHFDAITAALETATTY